MLLFAVIIDISYSSEVFPNRALHFGVLDVGDDFRVRIDKQEVEVSFRREFPEPELGLPYDGDQIALPHRPGLLPEEPKAVNPDVLNANHQFSDHGSLPPSFVGRDKADGHIQAGFLRILRLPHDIAFRGRQIRVVVHFLKREWVAAEFLYVNVPKRLS